jgi:Alanine-zipper, major outer membrane lipoprotein
LSAAARLLSPRRRRQYLRMEPTTRLSTARRVLILSVVLAGALAALAIVQRERALERQYEEAEERAELYAGTVLGSALESEDVVTPPEGERRQAVAQPVRGFVLSNPLVARVRVWRPDGTLLFSTDPAELPGKKSRDAAIAVASRGRVESRLAEEELTLRLRGEKDRRVVPLFQTFAPLRLQGFRRSVGAVEVEQFAVALRQRADDPWWIVQAGTSGVTVVLALLALVSIARGMDRSAGSPRGSSRPAAVRRQSPKERIEELAEALRRSEAERAMLPAGRSETLLEANVRELRRQLHESQAHAKAAEALVAGKGDLSAVKEQLSAAAREVDEAVDRARIAEERADAAEARATAAAEAANAAAQQIEQLEGELQELTASSAGTADVAALTEEVSELRSRLAETEQRVGEAQQRADEARKEADEAKKGSTEAHQRAEAEQKRAEAAQHRAEAAQQRADEMEERATEAESRHAFAGSLDAPAEWADPEAAPPDGQADELLRALEDRLVAAEALATETEARVRSFEEQASEGGSRLRQRLENNVARKLGGTTRSDQDPEPEMDLRKAIARSLRGPLTRASGLTLSLQGAVETGDGKAALRQLSSSLRRLDQFVADLQDVHRLIDGSLPLKRRRTDLAALMATTLEGATYLDDRLVRLDADTVHARVDPVRARQIVEGMLDVARERTRSSASIVVRVRDTDGGARVSVEDDNKSPVTLGPEMTLAVRLAELHGAEITVDGSSTIVVFPKETARRPAR